MKGAWVYNWIKRCYEWIENGKVYPSPAQVPSKETKRPYVDPGKPLNKS